MSHNNQKKIAAINDYSGFGRCSIAVELPIISALKVQCCPLPTSILSNHTGFESFYFEDFTESMPAYIKEWEKLNLKFDGICTGFLGSHKQIEIVRYFFDIFKTPDNIVVVDPVMGDYGNLYATYTKETCEEMKKLVSYANILTPNLTEACILTGREYNAEYGNEELEIIAKQLSDMGPSKIVITGIVRGAYIANYCYEDGCGGYTDAGPIAGLQLQRRNLSALPDRQLKGDRLELALGKFLRQLADQAGQGDTQPLEQVVEALGQRLAAGDPVCKILPQQLLHLTANLFAVHCRQLL